MSEDLDDELLALVDQEEEGSSHKKQSKRRKPYVPHQPTELEAGHQLQPALSL